MTGKISLLLSNLKYPGRLLNLARMKRDQHKELDQPG